MSQDGSSERTLAEPLSLTASSEEFNQLTPADQARTRALVYMANKLWGDAYLDRHYVGSRRPEQSEEITDMTQAYLENAGDLFLDRPHGLFDLAGLVAEGSTWSMGAIVSALRFNKLDNYVLNLASGSITRCP